MFPWIGDVLVSPTGWEGEVVDVWISADEGPLVVFADGTKVSGMTLINEEWSIRL